MAEYIERDAAKNILLQHQHRFTCADEANGYGSVKWSEDVIYLSEAVNGMDAIPAADVRPVVRGKWTRRKSKLYTMCSACGYGYSNSHYHEVEEFKFCPNCGAMMEASDGKD